MNINIDVEVTSEEGGTRRVEVTSSEGHDIETELEPDNPCPVDAVIMEKVSDILWSVRREESDSLREDFYDLEDGPDGCQILYERETRGLEMRFESKDDRGIFRWRGTANLTEGTYRSTPKLNSSKYREFFENHGFEPEDDF